MRYHRSAALLVSLAALSVIVPAAQAEPPAGAGAGKVAPFKSGGGVSAQEVAIASFTPSYTGEPVDGVQAARKRQGSVLTARKHLHGQAGREGARPAARRLVLGRRAGAVLRRD